MGHRVLPMETFELVEEALVQVTKRHSHTIKQFKALQRREQRFREVVQEECERPVDVVATRLCAPHLRLHLGQYSRHPCILPTHPWPLTSLPPRYTEKKRTLQLWPKEHFKKKTFRQFALRALRHETQNSATDIASPRIQLSTATSI